MLHCVDELTGKDTRRTVEELSKIRESFDKPTIGNTVEATRGWQITSRTGFAIEKEKVIIIKINNRKPIIFSLQAWKNMNKVSSVILNNWHKDLEEVQGKDVIL